MKSKRVLTIQDISCVGQCSMTVALPVLSAWGHETCVLPTAILSTHTGGFGKPAIISLDGQLERVWRHWQENGISFDAIYTGYLGSISAVETAVDILDRFLRPGGVSIVDPAMADRGKLYTGLDTAYARAMGALCRRADVILPNLTEAALLAGIPYREEEGDAFPCQVMERLNHPSVVLTGVASGPEEMELLFREKGRIHAVRHGRVQGHFSGTGDLFAACFTGALVSGAGMEEAVKIAGELTRLCVQTTAAAPAHWYGLRFETVLPQICETARRLQGI